MGPLIHLKNPYFFLFFSSSLIHIILFFQTISKIDERRIERVCNDGFHEFNGRVWEKLMKFKHSNVQKLICKSIKIKKEARILFLFFGTNMVLPSPSFQLKTLISFWVQNLLKTFASINLENATSNFWIWISKRKKKQRERRKFIFNLKSMNNNYRWDLGSWDLIFLFRFLFFGFHATQSIAKLKYGISPR